MFLIGFAVIVLGMAFWVLVLGGNIMNFIDIPSLVVILFPLLGVLTATKSFKVFYAGLRAAIFPKKEIAEEMRGRAATLFRLMSKTAAIVAVIAVLICLKNILHNMNFSIAGGAVRVGINLLSALMVPFYALLLSTAVFEPVVFILKKRHSKK